MQLFIFEGSQGFSENYDLELKPEISSEPIRKRYRHETQENNLHSTIEIEEEQFSHEMTDRRKSIASIVESDPDKDTFKYQRITEDEFDLLGKKIAHQIRDISKKSKRKAREVEIKFLQLLMEVEV